MWIYNTHRKSNQHTETAVWRKEAESSHCKHSNQTPGRRKGHPTQARMWRRYKQKIKLMLKGPPTLENVSLSHVSVVFSLLSQL